jgi:hypothetical protein
MKSTNVPWMFLLLLAAGGALLPPPWCWLSAGLGVASVALLWPGFRQWCERRRRASEALALLLIFSVATVMVWHPAQGMRPLCGDHPLHYYRFWYFITHLLPSGQLYAWSSSWFAGEPVGYVYPFASSVWVTGVYGAALGLLSLSQAYAAAIWLAYAVEGAAIYYAGRYIFGRAPALVAALLFLTDTGGGELTGGAIMTVRRGAWPNTLSVALSTMALVFLLKLMRAGRLRDGGWFALCAGAALLLHPMQLINLPLIVICALAAGLLTGELRLSRKTALALAGALGLAALIGSLWVWPFLSARAFTYTLGKPWRTLAETGRALAEGSALDGVWPFASVLGLLGALVALGSRESSRFAVGILFFLCLFLGASDGGGWLAALISEEYAKKVEFMRFGVLARPFLFLAAGEALFALLRGGRETAPLLRSKEQAGRAGLWRYLRWWVAAAAAAPLMMPFVESRVAAHSVWDMFYQTGQTPAQRAAMIGWINARAAEDPRFFRVALFDRLHYHTYSDLGTELARPLYNIGWTPGSLYKYYLGHLNADELQALGVRYMLVRDHQRPEVEGFNRVSGELLKPAASFGELEVWEFLRWRAERFQVIQGAGEVRALKFDEEEIHLEAAPGSAGKLMLGVSYFDRWQAERDGRPIPIQTTQVGAPWSSAFMTVDLQPGVYHFRFVRQWPERLGPWLCLAGLLAAVALIKWGRSCSVENRPLHPGKVLGE